MTSREDPLALHGHLSSMKPGLSTLWTCHRLDKGHGGEAGPGMASFRYVHSRSLPLARVLALRIPSKAVEILCQGGERSKRSQSSGEAKGISKDCVTWQWEALRFCLAFPSTLCWRSKVGAGQAAHLGAGEMCTHSL